MPSLLHSRDERFGFWKNHRLTRIWSGKFCYRIHRIEAEQRDEFHFVAVFANEQFRAAVTLDLSRSDTRKKFHRVAISRMPSRPQVSSTRAKYVQSSAVTMVGRDRRARRCEFEHEHEHD